MMFELKVIYFILLSLVLFASLPVEAQTVIKSSDPKVNCYTDKEKIELDAALDQGIILKNQLAEAKKTLAECRTWRDKYKVEVVELEQNPLIKKELVIVEKRKFSKQVFIVSTVSTFILGLVFGKAL